MQELRRRRSPPDRRLSKAQGPEVQIWEAWRPPSRWRWAPGIAARGAEPRCRRPSAATPHSRMQAREFEQQRHERQQSVVVDGAACRGVRPRSRWTRAVRRPEGGAGARAVPPAPPLGVHASSDAPSEAVRLPSVPMPPHSPTPSADLSCLVRRHRHRQPRSPALARGARQKPVPRALEQPPPTLASVAMAWAFAEAVPWGSVMMAPLSVVMERERPQRCVRPQNAVAAHQAAGLRAHQTDVATLPAGCLEQGVRGTD